jgi:hypothetical protein
MSAGVRGALPVSRSCVGKVEGAKFVRDVTRQKATQAATRKNAFTGWGRLVIASSSERFQPSIAIVAGATKLK